VGCPARACASLRCATVWQNAEPSVRLVGDKRLCAG
jgi:hypothetical protein